MIHKLLTLTRPLVILDTETTGVDTQQDRIVELGFQVYDAGGLKSEWRSLVDPDVPISPATTKVHGYTNAMMKGCRVCGGLSIEHPRMKVGESEWTTIPPDSLNVPQDIEVGAVKVCAEFKLIPRFSQIAERLARGFSDCDFCGKNVRFDLRILASEFARALVPWSYASARVVDADRLEALLNPRDLSTLYKKYTGKELEGAHGAMADVRASVEVIWRQVSQRDDDGAARLPCDLDALHRLQWPNWIDPDRKFAFDDDGVPRFTRWGKHANKPMRDVPTDYYDFILRSDFTADVKHLAAEAKLGRFPERTP